MSKAGSSIARWTLGVMVDSVMKYNPEMKRYYESPKEWSNGGHSYALTMKKLNRMLYHMVTTRQRWKWEDEGLTERKLSCLSSSAQEGGDTEA